MWRASISSQTHCNKSILGTYRDYAEEAILNKNFDYQKYFLITIKHFVDLEDLIHFWPRKKIRIMERNFYLLFIGFFAIYIKCDKQKMPLDFPLNKYSTDKDILFIDAAFENSGEKKSTQT